jgi:predicted ATPase
VATIERIAVLGWRSIRETRVALGPMTALIGANGAGKSNFASALRLLSYLESGSLGRFVADQGGAASLLHRGPKVTPEMKLDLVLRDEEGLLGYGVTLRSAAGDKLSVGEEAVADLSAEGQGAWTTVASNAFESALDRAPPQHPAARRVRAVLSRCKHLHVHDTSPGSLLRSTARIEDGRYLRSNGSNLASYLFKLRGDESDAGRAAWQRILDLVRRVAPFIKDLTPTPVRTNGGSSEPPASGPVRLDWVDELDDVYSVEHLSDGTLRAIAIITMLAQPPSGLPQLLVIDEPELGLHPLALSLVCELARSVSPRCQIMLATQAPAVLDHVRPEEILVADREDGATRLRTLDTAELKAWTDDYTLAELWNMNVLGGRP